MEIQYSGKPTEKDFAHMYRLATPLKPGILALWILIFLPALIVVIALPENALYYIPILIGLVFFALFWVFMPSISAQKIVKQNQDFQNVISGVISEEGIKVQTLHSSSSAEWGLYQSAVISPDVVLLYQTKVTWNFFIRSQFANDADWQALIALVKQNIRKVETRSTSHLPVVSGSKAQFLLYGLFFLALILVMIYNFTITSSR